MRATLRTIHDTCFARAKELLSDQADCEVWRRTFDNAAHALQALCYETQDMQAFVCLAFLKQEAKDLALLQVDQCCLQQAFSDACQFIVRVQVLLVNHA